MPVKLGAQAEHGFDQPLGLLCDCHRRIEHFLGLLVKVHQACRGGALSGEPRSAVEAALKYFTSAAPRHTEDEEQSLFPRLRGQGAAATGAALQKLAELEAEHEVADTLHGQVDSLFRRWLESGPLPGPDEGELERALATLRGIYTRHIQVEEREVFPLAGTVLSPNQLAELGREMARRRGLAPIHDPGRTESER